MARVLAALFCVAALGLAGCGGGGSTNNSLTTGGGNPRLNVPISLGASLMSPKYTRLSFLGPYLIQLENEDTAGHAVTIEHNGKTLETPTIAPGKTYEVILDINERGDYELSYPVDGKDVTGVITMGSE
jgi:hypothetical protein